MKTTGWLNQNIASLIAILCMTGGFGILYIVVLGKAKTEDNQVVTGALGIMMFVLGYYFGASKTGNERARAEMELKRLQEEKTATVKTEIKTDA